MLQRLSGVCQDTINGAFLSGCKSEDLFVSDEHTAQEGMANNVEHYTNRLD